VQTPLDRKSAFPTRRAKQRDRFNLPAFPTTTIGSFPQTQEVREQRAASRPVKPAKPAPWEDGGETPSQPDQPLTEVEHLRAEVAELKAKNSALRAENAELRERIDQLVDAS
jgi:hypothetical protein